VTKNKLAPSLLRLAAPRRAAAFDHGHLYN
jgi:hypothetical protein